jgi:hypothetical protein
MTLGEVKKLWGPQGKFGEVGAYYAPPGNIPKEQAKGLEPTAASAINYEGTRVFRVELSTGLRDVTGSSSKPVFDTPLSKYHTQAGIHLGSTGRAVKAAYPYLITRRSHTYVGKSTEYRIPPREGFSTAFIVRYGRVSEIFVEAKKYFFE